MIVSTTAVRSLSSLLVVAIIAAATTTMFNVGGATTTMTKRKLSKNAHTQSVVTTTATSDVEDSMPTECSAYAACADLKGDCCPNEKGVLLSCCLTPPPSPPTTTKCPSATLYYPLAIDNTAGSRHMSNVYAMYSDEPEQQVCGTFCDRCIGDTLTDFNTVYSDPGLTHRVGTLASTSKTVTIREGVTEVYGCGSVVTASIVYDTGSELTYGGYVLEGATGPFRFPTEQVSRTLAVTGGTGECVMHLGTLEFIVDVKLEEQNATIPNDVYGTVEFHLIDITTMLQH